MTPSAPVAASVVIPAHNEARGIARLLGQLARPVDGRTVEVVVVCNGCTDATAEIAAAFQGVVVVEIPQPSKREAMKAGSTRATAFPRLYVDADIELSAEDALRLADTVRAGDVLAAAPARVLPMEGVSAPVRWYYDVWQRLPQVQAGLFGRGVVALSEAGHQRFDAMPASMSDDLVLSEAFTTEERRALSSAVVVVHPPRTVADLLRRRARVQTGNVQADTGGLRSRRARTTWATLLRVAAAQPSLVPKLPVFGALTAVARLRARQAVRRGDFSTWLRDESSRR